MRANMARINITGEVISPGLANGELCVINFRLDYLLPRENLPCSDVNKEIAKFEQGVHSTIAELKEAIAILEKDSFLDEAEIIQTHMLMLEDAKFRRRVHKKIKVNRFAAEIALEHILQEMVEVLERSENIVFSQRAIDLRDVAMRLKKKFSEEKHTILTDSLKDVKNPVVATEELFPSLVLEAREKGVNAFIVEKGTSLSHAAILAKSFGLPALRVEDFYNLGLKDGIRVFVDAINGTMLVEPNEEEIDKVRMLLTKEQLVKDKAKLPVKIWINIVDPMQIKEDAFKGVEGIGLYRTEILFMESQEDFPTEEEQFTIYSSLFKKCRNHPVTIRTLDVGGDKTLPYFSFGPQENPYLGLRAHRIYRFHPEIFITQVRAILRAGLPLSNLRILYPMIESVEDLWLVQDLLKEAINSLQDEGAKYRETFQQGILVEVPSAVWNFRELLNCVDFASVGTNDLIQYFFAVDRNNANVSKTYRPQSPVALRILKDMVDIAQELNKSLSICGEITSDINFLPLLVGLGFDNLSVDFHNVAAIREQLCSLDILACRRLAQECLVAKRADEVKAILNKFISFGREDDLSHQKKKSEAVDPICKMVVHTLGNELVVFRGDRKFYFCCKQCRDKFIKIRAQNEKP
jgi:phosphoenolpyruvate-protein phosphotransferase